MAIPAPELEQARQLAQQKVMEMHANKSQLDSASIDLILTEARSHYAWTDRQVTEQQLRKIYEITSAGPTSMNSCPARIVFVTSGAGKERLAKSLKPANVKKMMGAPVTAIIAYDPNFWTELPYLFPHEDRRPHFATKQAHALETALRNSTLQGGYLMIAARSLGLDIGAMSGFSNAILDEEFFSENGWKSNFLCNIGYADTSSLYQRLPRFSFEQVCSIL